MPTDTPDQQITMPVDADAADNPLAFNQAVGDIEPKLVRIYTNEADRTARMLVLQEGNISVLQTENRTETYNGTNHVSLYTRSLYHNTRLTAAFPLTASSTVLQNVSGMSFPLPGIAGAIFRFRSILFYDSTTVADIKFAFTIPATATMRWSGSGLGTGSANPGDASFATTTTSGGALGFGGVGLGTVLSVMIEGEVTAGATAGSVNLQAAQNTSEATVANVFERSSLEAWRIS